MMPASPLDNLVKAGLLEAEPHSEAEIERLLCSGEARLRDAENVALSIDSRFDLLYNAAHALSLAALRRRGYRPRQQRFIVFQSLAHTLDLPQEQWRVLDQAHALRNRIEYEGAVPPTEQLVEAVLRVTRE